MIRPRTATIAALALTAALIVAPATAVAKPKVRVEPASRTFIFDAKGSKGWRLEVNALVTAGQTGRQSFGVYARGPLHQEVAYIGVEGQASENGRMEWKVPGLGRVDVRFEQRSETPVETSPLEGCTVEGESAMLKGVFRGTIRFHGEADYTTVDRTSGRGEVFVSPREVCPPQKKPNRAPQGGRSANFKALDGGRDLPGGGKLDFTAFSDNFGLGAGPFTVYYATYTHRRHGLKILATTKALDEAEALPLTGKDGMPSEATVEPPAPFSGSATFKLETPTTASWSGDLTVELQGLGRVGLAEPGWWAGACEANGCTDTFPPGTSIGFFTFSRLR